MMVGVEFPGDEAEQVKHRQHDSYMKTIVAFYHSAAHRVFAAERTLGLTESVTGEFFRQNDGFDHRVVQQMHDRIASFFRFQHFRWPLFHSVEPVPHLQEQWKDFAALEFTTLLRDADFEAGFFAALRFANQPKGYAGEAGMDRVQRGRYYAMMRYMLPNPASSQYED